MKRLSAVLLAVVVLAAAGFAVASIASGARLLDVLTGTTATTATTSTSTTAEGGGGRKVTVCHVTGSKKHPGVTISVSQHAVASVIKHGGHVGPCTGSETPKTKGGGSDEHHTTTTATTTTTTTTTESSGDDSGKHGNGNGNSGEHHGKGH